MYTDNYYNEKYNNYNTFERNLFVRNNLKNLNNLTNLNNLKNT